MYRSGTRSTSPWLRALPGVVQRDGLAAAAEPFAAAEATLQESVAAAEPAPGDEAQVEEMTSMYQEAGDLTVQAVGAKSAKGDGCPDGQARLGEARRPTRWRRTSARRACATPPAGPYATVGGLAAVRWGDRASQLCRARDKSFMSFQPDGHGSVRSRHPPLAAPDARARVSRAVRPRIKRFLDKYAASLQAQAQANTAFSSGDNSTGEQLNAKGNRLVSESTDIMYKIGFAIGFDRFCSAKPGLGRPVRCSAA